MSYLYVCEQGASVSYSGNRFRVTLKDGMERSVPAETLEVIEVIGNISITTGCMTECLKRGINIVFFSMYGSYYGRLLSTNHVNVERQRKQALFGTDDKFMLDFSKRIIDAKINNQIVVLRRYARNRDIDLKSQISAMQRARISLQRESVADISSVMGHEGNAARIYFRSLGEMIDDNFSFTKRTRRPPLDPFNSLISLGYSIVMHEIYGRIEAKGLNPYFGFMHKDHEKHPTLASDLLEEWRAVLVDSLAMGMLNGHELLPEHFYTTIDEPGVFLSKEGLKLFINKLEAKMRSETKYLDYIEYPVSFRRAIDLQINQLAKVIESRDVSLYHPIMIR